MMDLFDLFFDFGAVRTAPSRVGEACLDGVRSAWMGPRLALHAIDATRVHQTRAWVVCFFGSDLFRAATRAVARRRFLTVEMTTVRPW
jgi:hypothetical protein